MKIQKRVVIYGRVQGVFYRDCTQKKASKLGITGWVKNTLEGTVEAVFQGDESNVEKMVIWCHQGSPASQVVKVEVKDEDLTEEYSGFSLKMTY